MKTWALFRGKIQRCYKYPPTSLSEHKVMCTAHGPFFTRLRYNYTTARGGEEQAVLVGNVTVFPAVATATIVDNDGKTIDGHEGC